MKVLICLSIVLACKLSVCLAHVMITAPDHIKLGESFTVECMGHVDNASIDVGVSLELRKDDHQFYLHQFAGNINETKEVAGINRTQIEVNPVEVGRVEIINPTNETVGLYVCYFTHSLNGNIQTESDTKKVELHTGDDTGNKGVASLRAFNIACILFVMLKFLL